MELLFSHFVAKPLFHILRYMVNGTLHFVKVILRPEPENVFEADDPLTYPSFERARMAVDVMSPELNELDGEFRGMCAVAAAAGCVGACLLAKLAIVAMPQINFWFLSALRDQLLQLFFGAPFAMVVGFIVSLRLVPLGRIGPVAELRRDRPWRNGFGVAFVVGLVVVSAAGILLVLPRGH